MEVDQHMWRDWASALHRWGVEGGVATILEAIGPLNILSAQAIYLAQPLFRHAFPDEHLDGMARMLEDATSTKAFIRMLREASST